METVIEIANFIDKQGVWHLHYMDGKPLDAGLVPAGVSAREYRDEVGMYHLTADWVYNGPVLYVYGAKWRRQVYLQHIETTVRSAIAIGSERY